MKMSEKMKDILERALKTFVQATVADLLANITVLGSVLDDITSLEKILLSVGVGAVAAGISAVWNSVISPIVIDGEEIIEDKINQVDSDAPAYLKGFMDLTGVDLSDMTVGALQKIVVSIDAKVNGNLKTDMIEAIMKRVEEMDKKNDVQEDSAADVDDIYVELEATEPKE